MSDIDMFFNPEKYNKKVCTHCNGYGSSLKEKEERCTRCGGTGLVDKDTVSSDTKQKDEEV